jgi:hypothetical protein
MEAKEERKMEALSEREAQSGNARYKKTTVEPLFPTLKRLWGFAKERCRGLAKKAHRAFALLAAINLIKWGRPLPGEGRPA